jgi:hypothetical protein
MQWFQTRPPWQLALFALALVVPEIAAINRFHSDPVAELDRAGHSWSRMQGAKDVGQYIHARAGMNDTLVVWASEPQIYAYADLPFTCLRTPLVFHLSILPGEIERFEVALKSDPPEWFVVGQGASTPFLPAFALDLLDRRFDLVAELSGKKIFKKRP